MHENCQTARSLQRLCHEDFAVMRCFTWPKGDCLKWRRMSWVVCLGLLGFECGTVGIGWKWAGSSYLPPFSISGIQPMHHQNPPKAPVKLPSAVLKALADTLEAGRCDASLQTLVMIP